MNDVRARAIEAELNWLHWRLELALRRYQAAGLCPPREEPFPGTSVSPVEAERLLDDLRGELPQPESELLTTVEKAEEGARGLYDALREQAAARGDVLPLDWLVTAFGLSENERMLLLLALAADLDARFGRLYAYLQNHFDRCYATLDLFERLQPGTLPRGAATSLLAPTRPLRFHGLIRFDENGNAPFPLRPIAVDSRIRRFVTGESGLDAELAGYADLFAGEPGPPKLQLADEDRAAFARFIDAVSARLERPAVFILRGPRGVGKQRWAREVAHAHERPVLSVDLPGLARHAGSVGEALRTALREARLHAALLVLRGWESVQRGAVEDSEDRQMETRTAATLILERALRGHPAPVFFAMEEPNAPAPSLLWEAGRFTLHAPGTGSAELLWNALLPAGVRADELTPHALGVTAGLTPGRIEDACIDAFREAQGRDGSKARVGRDDLVRALKKSTQHSLGNAAILVESQHAWDDLIVLDDVRAQLQEMRSRYGNRRKVMEDWGLEKRFRSASGLSALFDGPPGTGKTMAAGIIAKDLGLDLYQIDLSRVVDRYVGETEKKLARIFDEAERSHVMLLFDEADSLFSARTKVQSSNDRYANLEVNYLLQRLDHFTGVAVLTTNFADSIDNAFVRRLTLRVTFCKPEARERARLWSTMLAFPGIPKANIDYDRLAEQYELAGGHIRNAVLRATYTAASTDRPVDEEILSLAARVELKQSGMLVAGNPYADLMNLAARGSSGSS